MRKGNRLCYVLYLHAFTGSRPEVASERHVIRKRHDRSSRQFFHVVSLRVRDVQKRSAVIASLNACLPSKKKLHISTDLPPLKEQQSFKPHRTGGETKRQATRKVTKGSVSGPDLGRNKSGRDVQQGQSEALAGNQSKVV